MQVHSAGILPIIIARVMPSNHEVGKATITFWTSESDLLSVSPVADRHLGL